MNVLRELRGRFARALAPLTSDPAALAGLVKPTQDPKFGDFQANCAMPLAKQLGSPPRAVAEQIVAGLDVTDLCLPPEIAGPGFINLTLRDEWIEAATNQLVHDQRFGVDVVSDPKVVIIDYSSPNVAKPMHVGHIRSTLIGAALYRLFQFVGHRIQSDNHIGDWGTQFGMIIYGYKHFLDREAYRRDPVAELGRLYRLVNQLADYWDAVEAIPTLEAQVRLKQSEIIAAESAAKDAQEKTAKTDAERTLKRLRLEMDALRQELAQQTAKRDAVERDVALDKLAKEHPLIAVDSRRETARLHAGDAENLRLWNEFLPNCLLALEAVYRRLEIEFDMALGESFYQPMLNDVVDALARSGIARQSDGAMCIFFEENAAPFIIRKTDGAFTYATTDLATIRYRTEMLQAQVMLYVVDARQSEHFRLLFETARRWGYREVDYRHVSFGTILGEDKRPFKTRSGDTVGLESLLDEALVRARSIVDENDDAKGAPELDDQSRNHGRGNGGNRRNQVRRPAPQSRQRLCLPMGQDAGDDRRYGDLYPVLVRKNLRHFSQRGDRAAGAPRFGSNGPTHAADRATPRPATFAVLREHRIGGRGLPPELRHAVPVYDRRFFHQVLRRVPRAQGSRSRGS